MVERGGETGQRPGRLGLARPWAGSLGAWVPGPPPPGLRGFGSGPRRQFRYPAKDAWSRGLWSRSQGLRSQSRAGPSTVVRLGTRPPFPVCSSSAGGLRAPGRAGARGLEGSGAAHSGGLTLAWALGGVWQPGGPSRGVDRQVVNPEGHARPGGEESWRRSPRGRGDGREVCPDFSRVSVYSRCDLGRQHGLAGLTCSMGSQVRSLRQPCGLGRVAEVGGSASPGLASWGLSSLVCTPRRCW